MHTSERIFTGFRRKLPVVLQAEAAECGLACIAMITEFHGFHTDLRLLRQKFPISLKGATLAHLIKITRRLGLSSRALRVDLNDLTKIRVPCVMHWEFNHFVVLQSVSTRSITIHDPARGIREIKFDEASKSFTGVLLELWPSVEFATNAPMPQLELRKLMGRISGLNSSLFQICTLAFVLEVFSVLTPLMTQWVVDNVFTSSDRELLITLAIAFSVLLVVQQCVSAVQSWCIMHLSTTLSLQWKTRVFEHLVRLPIQFFEKRHVGDVVSRFGSIDSIHQTLTTAFLAAVLDGVMTLITLSMMMIYSPPLASIAILAMLLYGTGRWATYAPFKAASHEIIVKSAKTQTHFLETVRGIKPIRLFQREAERRAAWIFLLVDQVNANLRSQKMQLVYKQVNGILFGTENIAILFFGANMVINGNLSVGMLMAFIAYKSQFNSRIGNLIDNFFSLKLLRLQGERLADIVLHPIEEGTDQEEFTPRIFRGSIEARGVQFRYAHGEPTILAGVDFQIAPGECVAIIGSTGCGKSTLLNILLGILKPTRGEVCIDGTDISSIGTDALRRAIGTVMQDDSLFAGSISDNICFFEQTPDRERIISAAATAGVHSEISSMPMGYNTLVGDMGNALSGGQRQRILLARALYKKPAMLFLDEATCHLNTEKETEILTAIKAMKITRLMIAHRPETIAAADKVILLANGRVAWAGEPHELGNQKVESTLF